jgi:hypothetical protein
MYPLRSCVLEKEIVTVRARVILTAALMLLSATARAQGQQQDELTAIVAVPLSGAAPAALAARFGTLLPEALKRAGFTLLDPRQVDIKLADRPDLLSGCDRDLCLLAQGRLLGVRRLILPRVQAVQGEGGIGMALTLFRVTPAEPPSPARIERVAEAVELCRPCQGAAMEEAVGRIALQLRRAERRAEEARLWLSASQKDARLFVDGTEVGRGQAALDLAPGSHVIAAETPAGRTEQKVVLLPREQARVELQLLAGPRRGAPLPAKVRPFTVAKWALAGAGVLALIAGTTLWALDGQQRDCARIAGQTQCPEVLDTAPAGIGLFTTGAVLLGGSAVLFGLDYRRGREGEKTALLRLGGRF